MFNKLLTFRDLEPSLTISSLAETLNVSTTTIFRMVKKLDYKHLWTLDNDFISSSRRI
ncbi:MAG: HTH domain-containing protein [Thomasclavelia ramosa]